MLRQQQDEIALKEKELALVGENSDQRARIIEQLKTEQELKRRGIDLAGTEGQAIIANAARLESLTQELERQQTAFREIEDVVGSALDRFADTLAQGKLDWKSWGDAGRAVLEDLSREVIKLAVLNPLKNALFGSDLSTLSDIGTAASRLFANLFHDGGLVGTAGPGRSIPALAFAGAPRLHVDERPTQTSSQTEVVPTILFRHWHTKRVTSLVTHVLIHTCAGEIS
jgi:hypothetical protein